MGGKEFSGIEVRPGKPRRSNDSTVEPGKSIPRWWSAVLVFSSTASAPLG